jgi:hypothetical protein
MKFLGYRGPAYNSAALEHRYFESGGRQIRGADQSIVAAADNDRIAQDFSHSVRRCGHGRRCSIPRPATARGCSPE